MNEQIIKELIRAYGMELETVQNYIAASVNLDGVRSDVIKKALAADVPTELLHAQQLKLLAAVPTPANAPAFGLLLNQANRLGHIAVNLRQWRRLLRYWGRQPAT